MTTQLDTRLGTLSPAVISLFRVVMGFLLICHGAQKLFAWPVGMPNAAGELVGPAVPAGTWPFWYAGVIEFVLGLLILAGLFTRIAAFIASGEMAFAYFTQHQPNGLLPIENGGELAVAYCFGFFLLVFIGGGAYALDSMRRKG
ncbi:DoxX family protein [Mycobacterium sp. CBMA293]|uniref:DoxX family protein n=1 Tax=unclassified Mycolicibacterium TaxID=2636767 RepID=UPI0012DFA13E|nr:MULTISPECIES: DoxX family protein [unclassified Mycolicibacterium]MUL45543.1 DoxX family protein [Mycolicibacterium sp. CBMA 360]MUL60213.1 DoxX family protein [Mycolicibacterium sp. CBMA 335]MUL71575.1 DoxX family protein [Mycolicibacterium sp. CBMA 311]MUL73000.1 DoxX family protein [Mycolicibacterium sp. CBMA 311]MUL96025.1 DoxX family protein [Mycolicibacterium sp. CBMA 230]